MIEPIGEAYFFEDSVYSIRLLLKWLLCYFVCVQYRPTISRSRSLSNSSPILDLYCALDNGIFGEDSAMLMLAIIEF